MKRSPRAYLDGWKPPQRAPVTAPVVGCCDFCRNLFHRARTRQRTCGMVCARGLQRQKKCYRAKARLAALRAARFLTFPKESTLHVEQ